MVVGFVQTANLKLRGETMCKCGFFDFKKEIMATSSNENPYYVVVRVCLRCGEEEVLDSDQVE